MGIQSYTSVAASNTLFPENMLPSAVNDNMRQVQADLKTWYSDSEWQRQEEAPSRASAATFKITGDVTTKYLVNRKVRVNDAATYYGTVTASSYSAPDTTVTVELESGSLTASFTAVAIAALSPTNLSVPPIIYNGKAVYAADGGASDAYAVTLTPVPTSYVTGMIIRFKANSANTGAATLNVNSLGAKTIKKSVTTDLSDNDILASQIVTVVYDGTNFQMLSTIPTTAPFIDSTAIIKGSGDATKLLRFEVDGFTTASTRVITPPDYDISNWFVQQVRTQTAAVASGTTALPKDDTIPQNTEGDQYMTLSITPKNANNILKITAKLNVSHSGTTTMSMALFQDTTANALACAAQFPNNAVAAYQLKLSYYMTAGTTSATTFKIRAGVDSAGTLTINGISAARLYGGVYYSYLDITEYSV
jgi:hypothetical protein